ncbi:MAG: hypothetical protein ABW110_06130, partial [Steroidobacteraceae bacterium]
HHPVRKIYDLIDPAMTTTAPVNNRSWPSAEPGTRPVVAFSAARQTLFALLFRMRGSAPRPGWVLLQRGHERN